jgi:hypothetical protein
MNNSGSGPYTCLVISLLGLTVAESFLSQDSSWLYLSKNSPWLYLSNDSSCCTPAGIHRGCTSAMIHRSYSLSQDSSWLFLSHSSWLFFNQDSSWLYLSQDSPWLYLSYDSSCCTPAGIHHGGPSARMKKSKLFIAQTHHVLTSERIHHAWLCLDLDSSRLF